jgi:hypothetical protein
MQRRRAVIEVRTSFRSKDNLDLGGTVRNVTKTVDDASHISNREDRRVIDRDNVGSSEFTARATKTVANRRSINLRDEGTTKAGASVKSEAQR